MTNEELIEHIANCSGITKAQAKRAFDCMQSGIITGLKDTGSLRLPIGVFSIGNRLARMGRNPRTGESIEIPARKVVKFKAGKMLKDAILENESSSNRAF